MDNKVVMAKLFSDAKKDLLLFRKVFLPVPGKELPTPEYQKEWGNVLIRGEHHYAVEGYRESGKALSLRTIIPTPTGPKTMADIRVGDDVFDQNGKPIRVTFESKIFLDHPCMKVSFDTGEEIIADVDHIWLVYDKHKRRYNHLTTLELYGKQNLGKQRGEYQEKAFRVPVSAPLDYPAREFTISPYDMGLWLGDGTSTAAAITAGKQDFEETYRNIDWKIKGYSEKESAYTIYLNKGFLIELRRLGLLGDKHIPEEYMYSSIEQRKSLLGGLIDSDGDISKSGTKAGTVSFCNTNKRVAMGAYYVALSLGYKATIRSKTATLYGKDCGIVYTVCFKTTDKLCRLERKAVLFPKSQNTRSLFRSISSVEKVPSEPTKCIKVDSKDGLFLCSPSNIITHNSSLVLRAFPLHCLTYPSKKNQYIVFIMANQSSASKRLKEIETEWLHDELLSMNLVRVVEQSATGFEVIVKDDNGEEMWVRLEAYGKGSAVRGLLVHDCRPSLVLIDDPQDTDDSKSDTVQENDWEWFLSDILFLGKETRIFLIGNNLGEKCLIERIIENQKDLGFVGVRIPILDMEGNSVWPERWSTEDVIAERESMRRIGKLDVWEREKMCLAISPESQLFRKEYFRYYEPQNLHIRDLNVFTTVDLAISKKETADYTVVCTIGVNADNQWFILDMKYGRYDPSESMDNIFEAVTRYKPLYVGIEKVAYQAALSHFVEKEMPKRNIFFTTKDLEAKEKKEERIKAIQPRFKAGTVMFPKGASFLGELESELLAFPKSLHDKPNCRG